MGEHEQMRGANGVPGEIVEVYRRPAPCPGRVPGEIVEVYRQPDRREVVERYERALPSAHPHAERRGRPGTHRNPPPQAEELPDLLTDLLPPPDARNTERANDSAFRLTPPPGVNPRMKKVPLRQKRKRRTGLRLFVLGIVAALGLTVAAQYLDTGDPTPAFFHSDPFEHYGWNTPPDDEDTAEEITIPDWPTGQGGELSVLRTHGDSLTPQEVYKQVNPSVVTVMVDIDRARMSVGTGVIFTEDGYFVTNHHVVAGGRDCTVLLDTGRSCEARYVAGDAANDLAVLKIAPADLSDIGTLTPAEFGDSDLLTVGDPVYAIGNPLGWELRGTLTDGIVSAINRDVEVDGRTMTLIQTNAALNSGNSGGPLINEYGQVVGINVIKMSSDYSTIEGLGFAIPSALTERMVNDLLKWGKIQPEPSIGVSVLLEAETLEDGSRGLEVKTVEPNSAADKANIKPGDYILKADNEPLETSQDLLRIRRRFYLGDELTLTVWHSGEITDRTLVFEEAVN